MKQLTKYCTKCGRRTVTEVLKTNFVLNLADMLSKIPLWILSTHWILTLLALASAFVCYPMAFLFLFIGRGLPRFGILYRCTKCKQVTTY